MWAKLLGVTCLGVFVGAFMVELVRSDKKKDEDRESDIKPEPEGHKRASKATAASTVS